MAIVLALGTIAMTQPLYCLNVKLVIKPEVRTEFMECIKNNQHGTLTKEKLAVTYIWGEDEKTPNTFHFFEQYQGRKGFEAHTKTAHFAAWEQFASTDPFAEPPTVSFYEEDSPGREGLAQVPDGQSLFCLNVALHCKPERREDFLLALRADQAGALDSEPACVSYLFGEDENQPNTFHMFERYIGRHGFEEHAKSDHYAKWSEFKASEPFSAPATVAYYSTIGKDPLPDESDGASTDAMTEAAPVGAPPAGFEWGGVF